MLTIAIGFEICLATVLKGLTSEASSSVFLPHVLRRSFASLLESPCRKSVASSCSIADELSVWAGSDNVNPKLLGIAASAYGYGAHQSASSIQGVIKRFTEFRFHVPGC